ncbi:GNAT family N-acetyltransferase [Nonomuraea polychroma]|uniref:GNAT family N-acetyltransferase n=1 Tax=Nonomuraea polychroma TaxID=46176 RepID=UPI003D8C55B5
MVTAERHPGDEPADAHADGDESALVRIWPLFGLCLTTERLELAVPTTHDLLNLCQVSASIQPPDEVRFQQSFLYAASPERERQLLQRHWRALAHWRPDSWDLHLAIRLHGTAIGLQNMWANDFAITRTVETGSWIGLPYQGRGYGTEARAAALDLAFTHLGAVEARTEYIHGNEASLAVSRKLGYRDNGHKVTARNGERLLQHLMALDANMWKRRSGRPTRVVGLTDCLDLFRAKR